MERLKREVRKEMVFEEQNVGLSGPVAVEFEELVIASLTVLGVKGAKLGESG